MTVVLLIAAGVAVAALAKRRSQAGPATTVVVQPQQAAPAQPKLQARTSQSSQQKSGDPTPQIVNAAKVAAPTLAAAGVAAGGPNAAVFGLGMALSAAAGKLGYELNGAPGAVAGALQFTHGTVANVAAAGGKELDVAFGGEKGGPTSTVAAVGAGTAGWMLSVFGWSAGITFAVYAAIAYTIATIVSDLNRLAYGQKGATDDYWKKWNDTQASVFAMLSAADVVGPGGVRIQKAGLAPERALRLSYPFADGYTQEQNRAAFRQWMKRGRGLLGLGTTSDGYHAKFGRDRGYFAGEPDVTGSALVIEPTQKSLSVEYYQQAQINPGELRTTKSKDIVGWERKLVERAEAFVQPPGASGAFDLGPTQCQIWKDEGKDEKDFQYRYRCMQEVSVPVYEEREYLADPMRLEAIEYGAKAANVANYLTWMWTGDRGFMVSDDGHLKAGLAEGRFTGTSVGDGKLRFDGKTFDFRTVPRPT